MTFVIFEISTAFGMEKVEKLLKKEKGSKEDQIFFYNKEYIYYWKRIIVR